MIVSASYRTDIPAFYGAWFERRLEAGFCEVRNPYGRPYAVRLDRESVSGFVFWTRNAAPFLPVLDRLASDGYPFVVHCTINAYPRLLETSVIDPARAARQVHGLARAFGPRDAVWRYDPIIVTGATPLSSHVGRFSRLAESLAGAVDEAVLSFASFDRKTRRNLAADGGKSGLTWADPAPERKRQVTGRASRHCHEAFATCGAYDSCAAWRASTAMPVAQGRRAASTQGASAMWRAGRSRPGGRATGRAAACHESLRYRRLSTAALMAVSTDTRWPARAPPRRAHARDVGAQAPYLL